MIIDLIKEKKAAEDYLKKIVTKTKNTSGGDIGINKEVKTSQIKNNQVIQTATILSPKEKLQAYLQSIGQQ